jgi:hypothetical protein
VKGERLKAAATGLENDTGMFLFILLCLNRRLFTEITCLKEWSEIQLPVEKL